MPEDEARSSIPCARRDRIVFKASKTPLEMNSTSKKLNTYAHQSRTGCQVYRSTMLNVNMLQDGISARGLMGTPRVVLFICWCASTVKTDLIIAPKQESQET